jgi:hypothetical protein
LEGGVDSQVVPGGHGGADGVDRQSSSLSRFTHAIPTAQSLSAVHGTATHSYMVVGSQGVGSQGWPGRHAEGGQL